MSGITVKGYLVKADVAAQGMVYHYAVFSDGAIKRTVLANQRRCEDFNRRNWQWQSESELPADAEYIGIYPANM